MQLVIGSEGVCDGVGVVARESISKGECVALIPRTALLSCANSNIRHLVQEDETLLEDSTCSWVPLLLSLAAEHSYQVNTDHTPSLPATLLCRSPASGILTCLWYQLT